MAAEWADVEIAVEKHCEADHLNQHDAVARDKTFAAHSSARLQCADQPISGEDDPWDLYPEV